MNTNFDKITYSSINKALTIDFASSVISFNFDSMMNSPYDIGKYFIRSTITEVMLPIMKDITYYPETITALVSGSLGGAFKYGYTGQNIFAGMLNNIGYELCNNNKACSTPIGSFIATFFLEAIDPMTQEILKNGIANIAKLNYIGAASSALIIASTIEFLYTPNENYAQDVMGCDSNQCILDATSNALDAAAKHFYDIIGILNFPHDEL